MRSIESPRWIIDQVLTQKLDSKYREYFLFNESEGRSIKMRGDGTSEDPIVSEVMAGDQISLIVEPMKDLARQRKEDLYLSWDSEPFIVTQAGNYHRLYLDERQREGWNHLLNPQT